MKLQGSSGLTGDVMLRGVRESDLDTFFEQQLDPEANFMAAFTVKDPADKETFTDHWAKITADEGITVRTVIYDGEIAGYIVCHGWFGEPEISYWIGKEYWGQGIGTRALVEFLSFVETRPLYARAAKDNFSSIRALEKGGFKLSGQDEGFANARGEEIEEVVYCLRHKD